MGERDSATAVADQIEEMRIAPRAAAGWARRSAKGAWLRGAGGRTASVFDLASLTKPMTAFAIARSDLRLDAHLGDVLDLARGTVSEDAPIELLLAHRAGLIDHLPVYAPLVSGGARDRAAFLEQMARGRRADASGAFPSEGFAPVYSDLSYALVGEALARQVGARDAGEAIASLVVRPLGAESSLGTARDLSANSLDFASRVEPTEIVPWRGGEIRGHVHDENAWAIDGEGGSGHAGMFGTIDAVLDFACAAVDAIEHHEGPLFPLDPRSQDLSWMTRARQGGSLRAGFDGKSEEGSSAGIKMGLRAFGHLGFTGTSVWIDPDRGIVVALLTNRVHPTRENIAIRAARPPAHDRLFEIASSAF